jgi:hypothetical protein
MIKKTTLALVAALAVTSFASPVFAQSYNPGDGTGNALSFAYGAGGIKQRSVAVPPAGLTVVPQRQIAARDGYHSFAYIPSDNSVSSSNSPAATGGGSAGYNAMLLIH